MAVRHPCIGSTTGGRADRALIRSEVPGERSALERRPVRLLLKVAVALKVAISLLLEV